MTITVREAELSHPVAGIAADPKFGSAIVLARWYSEPVALADVPLRDGRADPEQVARSLWRSVEKLVDARYAALSGAAPVREAALARPAAPGPAATPVLAAPIGPAVAGAVAPPAGHPGAGAGPAAADFPAELLASGLRLSWPPAYLLGRAATLRNAPPVSVIVCAGDHPGQLARCLPAVLRQDYPDFEIIVVDSAPAADAVAALVSALSPAASVRGVPLRRVAQRPGLSWARNTGLAAASGTVVAYLDDDQRPDRHWLAELARGFTLGKRVAGVSGLALPAELAPAGHERHRQSGGHGTARGFTPELFDPLSSARQHPLAAFGFGASLAFTRAALTELGESGAAPGESGADRAPGLDTAATAPPSVDMAAIAGLVAGPGRLAYWPGAVTWRGPADGHRTLPG